MANSTGSKVSIPVPTAEEIAALDQCSYRVITPHGEITCSAVARLAQLETVKCQVGADACRACGKLDSIPNSVTASMARHAVGQHGGQSEMQRVIEDTRSLIGVSPGMPVKRVTAADLPCVWRGDLITLIDCELCGARGEKVEVHECLCNKTSGSACTPGRWTNAPKIPSLVCLTCPNRTVSVDVEGMAFYVPAERSIETLPTDQNAVVPQGQSQNPCRLTIGMACYDDEPGVWMTIQTLTLYHADVLTETNAEILVVDSNPGKKIKDDKGNVIRIEGSKHGAEVRELCENWGGGIVRYIPAEFAKGTSAPRDLVFREARGEIVLCLDCHVMLPPRALSALVNYFTLYPDSIDIIQGPMLHHGCEIYATHMRPEWGEDRMFGKWETDDRIIENEPFEIPSQGLGLFACRKLAWRGFNPAFQGFGGEEGYIHEKFRQAGGKAVCLPELQWLHKFSRVDGVPYPLRLEDRFRNYLIGWQELGLDISEVIQQFTGRLPDATLGKIVGEAVAVFSRDGADRKAVKS